MIKVKQGHFETAILILHNLFFFYYGYRCLEALHLNIFMIQTLCTVMQLFRGSSFVWVLLRDTFDLIHVGYREQPTHAFHNL